MSKADPNGAWWADYTLEVGQTARWDIGPLRFWLRRGRLEWRLIHEWREEPEDPSGWSLLEAAEWPEGDGDEDTYRFAMTETTGEVRLRPLPCDRSVVARPKTSLRVLPGHRVRVFMSSPLWVEILAGAEPTALCELPAKRLSETWFGATTRDGEICYALKTNARTDLDQMPRAQYRFLTPIVIENHASDALSVERLNLPVPYLTIYRGDGGDVWSNEIHMTRTDEGGMASLDVRDGPPVEAAGAVAVSQPREVARHGQLFRAFGSLLGFD